MKNVKVNIDILVPPVEAIRAFTHIELLSQWWGVERAYIDPHEGGQYTLAWGISDQGIKYISTGIISAFDPEGLLAVDKYFYLNPERPFLGPLKLYVKATAMDKGCNLFLSQGPYPVNAGSDWDWYYAAVVDAWPKVVLTLKEFLEKRNEK